MEDVANSRNWKLQFPCEVVKKYVNPVRNKTKMIPTKIDRFRFTGNQLKTYVPEEYHLEIITKAGEKILQPLHFFAIPKELHFPSF